MQHNLSGSEGTVQTGDHLIAVGIFGTLLESKDGVAWESDLSGTAQTLNSVTFTGSQFIAVGDESTVATSMDGVFWKAKSLFPETPRAQDRLNAVAWGNGLALAGGSGGYLLGSVDGVNWKTAYVPDAEIYDILWTGKIWVVVIGIGSVLISEDGKAWTEVPLMALKPVVSATWTGKEIALAGFDGTILTSPDGKEWTTRYVGEDIRLVDIIWAGNQFVVVGPDSRIFTSPDAKEWVANETDGSPLENLNSVSWTGTELIGVGYGGVIFTSVDGKKWQKEVSPSDVALRSVISVEGKSVAVGGWGLIITKGVPDVGIRPIAMRHAPELKYARESKRLRIELPMETWGTNISLRIFSADGRGVGIDAMKRSDGMLDVFSTISGCGSYGFEVRGVQGKRASGSFSATMR